MVGNVEVGKSNKKILVVGQLGYHEENIIKPIINNLIARGNSVDRLGGNWDFFIPANFPNMVKNYLDSVPENLDNWDTIFFVDYWNMIVPMFDYLRSISNKKIRFVGMFHGSVRLENDVAQMILHSSDYETYLLKVYDTLIVHDEWIKDLMDNLENIQCAYHPYVIQFNRIRPEYRNVKRVIYAHRFDDDKGKDEFLDFVRYCSNEDIEFIVTDDSTKIPKGFNIKSVGRLTQKELEELCKGGGYAWSSAKSEMAHYAIMDLISYGLTPLLNHHPAYHYFDNRYKYSNNEDALQIIKDGVLLENDEWLQLETKLNKLDSLVDWVEN